MNLAEHFQHGGPLMYPIAVISVVALAVIFDRMWFFRRDVLSGWFGGRRVGDRLSEVNPAIVDWARYRRAADPVARVLAAWHLEGEEAARLEGDEALERSAYGLGILETMTNLSTNFGLLGTVIGVIGVFPHYISGDKESVVTYLGIALYTTVGGLIVFLYGYAFSRLFQALLERRVRRLRLATELAAGLSSKGE